MDIESLLNYDNKILREMIKYKEKSVINALSDKRMKEKLINPENKYELIWLTQEMPDEAALILFDDIGINILSKSRDLTAKLNGIITSCKKYVNKLLLKKEFCKLIIDQYQNLSYYLTSLEKEGALALAKYVQENHNDLLINTIVRLSINVQKDVIASLELPHSTKKKIVIAASRSAAEYLLNENPGFIHLEDYKYDELLKLFSKNCAIPSHHLSEKEFIEKITTIESIKDYRFLINNLSKSNDTSEITQARKKYYNQEILNYNVENNMLERYYQLYQELPQIVESNIVDYEKVEEILNKYFNFYGSGDNEWYIRRKLNEYIRSKDKETLKEFLVSESNLQLSNMIIDYHFEDIPFNFFLDIKQLLSFQQKENQILNNEDLEIYNKLINIDKLTYEEKIQLHNRLKQEDFISKNYDIFRTAKDKSASLIKEKILTKESVQKYYDKSLSSTYGVPIYVLEGQEFYAFVKSLYRKTFILTKEQMTSTTDGGSYSLDGSAKLNTYKDPRTNYNIIFSDFPTNQIVHMYPVDSYSKYVRKSDSPATPRVNKLYTPQELVETSNDYNEIILSQPNELIHNDELNNQLTLPTILGLYCYDEISNFDIESAKNLGVGIVLVKTKAYKINRENKLSMNDTLAPSFEQRYADNIDYLSKITEDDMVNRRKL